MATGNDFNSTIPVLDQAAGETVHAKPAAVYVVNPGGGTGGPVTIVDGGDVTEGALADPAVVTDAAGSVSAKLRGLVVVLLRVFALGTPVRVDPTGGTAQPVTASNVTVIPQAGTSGGSSIYSFLSTSAVQAANIKASAGQVHALQFFNNSATICYVRLYNQVASPATTDTPVYRALIPANTSGAGFVVPIPPGVAFGTGIGIRVTAAVADNDNTALAANAILGNVFYA